MCALTKCLEETDVALLSGFERVLAVTRTIGAGLAASALGLVVIAYTYEVVCRYFFGAPTWWSAELVSYLLCIMTFSMMPFVTATRGHVAVTILLDSLPPGWRLGASRTIAGIGAAACAAVAYFAFGETSRQFIRGIQMMAAHPIPKWWISVWIVIGFTLSALEFLRLALSASDSSASANGGGDS